MLDPAVGMRASSCLGKARDAQNFPSLPQDIKSGRSPLIHAVENNSLVVQLLLCRWVRPLLCGLSPTVSSGPDRLSLHPCHRPLLLPALALVAAFTLPAPTLPPRPPSASLGLHSSRL